MTDIYDIVVFEEYERDGETKSKGYTVGVAFPNKAGSGFNCQMPDGISVSGRFSLLKRGEKTEAP